MNLPEYVRSEIDAGALFVASHSAGKDSQAMLIAMLKMGVPANQTLIVHADLDDVEWRGNMDHIRKYAGSIPIITALARTSFWEMVERRGMFPSPGQRQCTSDLKRGPINREVRRYLKAHPEFNNRVVMCMGMRKQESANRNDMIPWRFSEEHSLFDKSFWKSRKFVRGRDWFEWLPIHDMTSDEVFASIAAADQEPHWAYGKGMSRLSCCFCIMASKSDLTISARENPELYLRYVEMEKRIGHTLSMSQKPLEAITGIKAAA